MKCHYEVLGVPMDVNDEDLKKSYRKLALRWHPDKNLDNSEEAKEQFQLVQQAYEVLSDSHERAWYDKHREAILKGGIGDDYKDDSLDVFTYFTSSCFKGYGDDSKGFYTVYREVFNKLSAEDSEFLTTEDSDYEVPNFGNSKSSYEDVVHVFYAFWQSYSTKKSYVWLEPYDIRDTPNRRVLRMVEKENKKVRDKARKERNEEVRNLVAFVRKRDKRVQAYSKVLEEKAAENAKKAEERRKKQLQERQEALKEYKESEWSKFSNIEHELKVIEANLAAQFGESEELVESESESETEEMYAAMGSALYCVACNKVFKTEKAFANHENSKKHKENVELLKEEVKQGEEVLKSAKESIQDFKSDKKVEQRSDIQDSDHLSISGSDLGLDSEEDNDEEEVEIVELKCKKKSKQRKVNRTVSLMHDSDDSSSQVDLLEAQSRKQRKKQKARKSQLNGIESVVDDTAAQRSLETIGDVDNDSVSAGDEESDSIGKKLKGKKTKDIRKQKANQNQENCGSSVTDQTKQGPNEEFKTEADEEEKTKAKPKKVAREPRRKGRKEAECKVESVKDVNLCCVTCRSEFPSKNKLFDHLKKTGHSVYVPKEEPDRTEEKGAKGKARKMK